MGPFLTTLSCAPPGPAGSAQAAARVDAGYRSHRV
jgi:hypothetical protein